MCQLLPEVKQILKALENEVKNEEKDINSKVDSEYQNHENTQKKKEAKTK